MQRILLIAPAWVGDTVMAQPLVARLKQRQRDALIDVYAPHWVAPIARRMPEVNEVLLNPFGHGELQLGARLRAAKMLSARNYQQAIVLPNSFKSALIPWFARIPRRTGFVGELRRGILNDARSLSAEDYPLMVERYALLAEAPGHALERPVPPPRLRIDTQSRDASLLRLNLSSQQASVALCPGAEYGPSKRWPAKHFGALARSLHEQGFQVWVIGSNKDQALGEAIYTASGKRCRNLCGATNLDEAVDVLSCVQAVVSNDSGLMHVAAALDKPLVALYGSSSPRFTPPLSPRARIVNLHLSCSPCFERECPLGHFNCMMHMQPEQVASELALAGLRTLASAS